MRYKYTHKHNICLQYYHSWCANIICFSMCFISLQNKNESNPEAIILNIVASE